MTHKNDTSPTSIARQMISAWEAVLLPRAWWLPEVAAAPAKEPPPPAARKPKKPAEKVKQKAPPPEIKKESPPKKKVTSAKKKTPPAHVAKPAAASIAPTKPRAVDAKHGASVSAKPAGKREFSAVEQGLFNLERAMAGFSLPNSKLPAHARSAGGKRGAGTVSKTSEKSKTPRSAGTPARTKTKRTR